MSPTQRSLKLLRDDGWFATVVEHWCHYTRRRKDLFGFADILALKEDVCLLVQTTSGSNAAHRLAKIADAPAAWLWLFSETRKIHVHGWAKRGPRGERKVWTCRVVPVTQDMLKTAKVEEAE